MGDLTIFIRTVTSKSSSPDTLNCLLAGGGQPLSAGPWTQRKEKAGTALLQMSQEQGSGPDVISERQGTQSSYTPGLAKFLDTLLVD